VKLRFYSKGAKAFNKEHVEQEVWSDDAMSVKWNVRYSCICQTSRLRPRAFYESTRDSLEITGDP
jgi:hypothetical protein